jgi:hypothetical protein
MASASSGIDFSSLFGDLDPAKQPDAAKKTAPKVFAPPVERVSDARIEALYAEAVSAVAALSADGGMTRTRFAEACVIAEKIFVSAQDREQDLLDIVFAKGRGEDPIAANCVNTAVLAGDIVRGISDDRAYGVFVVTAALLHDIGMDDCRDVVWRSAAIDSEDRSRLHDHPLIGASRLRALRDDYAARVAAVIEQEHERACGGGYPRGIRGDDIAEAAQIVGICDMYEALTHPRPQREALSPIGALKTIVDAETLFSSRVVKAFIARIGLCPKGTYVELNTKEIAWVRRQHSQMPASPVVEVVLNAKGEKAAERRIIDLSRGTRIYIVRAV